MSKKQRATGGVRVQISEYVVGLAREYAAARLAYDAAFVAWDIARKQPGVAATDIGALGAALDEAYKTKVERGAGLALMVVAEITGRDVFVAEKAAVADYVKLLPPQTLIPRCDECGEILINYDIGERCIDCKVAGRAGVCVLTPNSKNETPSSTEVETGPVPSVALPVGADSAPAI